MNELRILIVEDVPDMRKFIKNALTRGFTNCHVDETGDGIEAKKQIEMTDYDIVLLDWGIPQLSGEELLQWARSTEKYKNLPFIIVTGHRERERVIKAMELGISGYLFKPLTLDTLIQKIKEVIAKFGKK